LTGHPVFAAVYDRLTRSAERKFLGAHRAWLCARATRRVLDLGAGTLCAGCHPNRDTVAAIRRAGFAIGELERYAFGPIPGPLFVRGEAVST
jgi:hypothetical protein